MTQDRLIYQHNPNWLTINGQADTDLTQKLYSKTVQHTVDKDFTWDNVGYISDVSLKAAGSKFQVSAESLEKLRRACQTWDVDIIVKDISSHRKFIGPLIVVAKKLIVPIIKAFLKDSMRQQRAFNAAMLAVSLDLYEKKSSSEPKLKD